MNNYIDSAAPVGSVAKAMSILDCFTPEQPFLSLAQICSRIHQPKSTTLNLIRTLEATGYLIKSRDSQLYSLGYKILQHSFSLRYSMSFVRSSLPFLEELGIQTGMIIYLVTHHNGRVLYLDAIYPSRRFPLYSTSGRTHPMHCTSCGKAMLAHMPEDMVHEIIDFWGMERRTPNTITDMKTLMEELETIRNRGYAIDNEEETPSSRCMASVIRNRNGFPTAAVSISSSAIELTDSKIEEFAGPLQSVCNLLSEFAQQFPGNQEDPALRV